MLYILYHTYTVSYGTQMTVSMEKHDMQDWPVPWKQRVTYKQLGSQSIERKVRSDGQASNKTVTAA